jgi:hypothetical protein
VWLQELPREGMANSASNQNVNKITALNSKTSGKQAE